MILFREKGCWGFSECDPGERILLAGLAQLLDDLDIDDGKTLYQGLLHEAGSEEDQREVNEEWTSLTHGALRGRLRRSLSLVRQDLRTFVNEACLPVEFPSDPDQDEWREEFQRAFSEPARFEEGRLVIPDSHVDGWIMALNRARIAIHDNFDAEELEDDERLMRGEDRRSLFVATGYRVFTWVMDWLTEQYWARN